MSVTQPSEVVPLQSDADGVIRVGGTRVPLETVVSAFDTGATPEAICEDFPALSLADVYAVVAYTLRHRSEVDEYLAHRQERAQEVRREVEASAATRQLRERLRARRQR